MAITYTWTVQRDNRKLSVQVADAESFFPNAAATTTIDQGELEPLGLEYSVGTGLVTPAPGVILMSMEVAPIGGSAEWTIDFPNNASKIAALKQGFAGKIGSRMNSPTSEVVAL